MRLALPHHGSNGRALPVKSSSFLRAFLLLLCLKMGLAVDMRADQGLATRPLELAYTVHVERPTTHMVGIDIVARQVADADLKFVIPAWAPGRYAIYDFAKNVQEFSAETVDHHALPWTKLDKESWRVDAASAQGKNWVRAITI